MSIQIVLDFIRLARGRWFSPGTLASSTTKTGRHDIAEILLKVALNTKNQIKSNQILRLSERSIQDGVTFSYAYPKMTVHFIRLSVMSIQIAL